MATINIPDELRDQIAARASDAGYANVDEFAAAVLRAESQPTDLDDDLEALLLERVDGPSVEADKKDFQQMRAKLEAHLDAAAEAGK